LWKTKRESFDTKSNSVSFRFVKRLSNLNRFNFDRLNEWQKENLNRKLLHIQDLRGSMAHVTISCHSNDRWHFLLSPNDTWGGRGPTKLSRDIFSTFLNDILHRKKALKSYAFLKNANCHVTRNNVTKCHMGERWGLKSNKSVKFYLNGTLEHWTTQFHYVSYSFKWNLEFGIKGHSNDTLLFFSKFIVYVIFLFKKSLWIVKVYYGDIVLFTSWLKHKIRV